MVVKLHSLVLLLFHKDSTGSQGTITVVSLREDKIIKRLSWSNRSRSYVSGEF